MRRFVCGLAVLAAFVLPAAADIPINGQFLPDAGGVSHIGTFIGEYPSIPDWTSTPGTTVDWIGTYWAGPPVGGFSVDLDGIDPGGIQSNVILAPGQYDLTFYLAGNPEWNDRESSTKYLNVTAGEFSTPTPLSVDAQFSPGSDSSGHPWDLVWTLETLQFTVIDGGYSQIKFTSADTIPIGLGEQPCGPVVGGVSLSRVRVPEAPSVPVPEAGFYSAFALNLGGVLLFLRRRRKA